MSYILSIIGITAIIILLLSKKYFQDRVVVVKYNIINNVINDKDTINLILGSSHTFFGINSQFIEKKCYNLASPSQSLMEDYSIIKFIHGRNISIRKIVLPISYFSNTHFVYNNPIFGERIRTFDYKYTYNIKYPVSNSINEWFAFISAITNCIKFNKQTEKFDSNGNIITECINTKHEISNAYEAFNRHNLMSNFNVNNPYIDSIYECCKVNKINLFLIVMPFTKAYRELINKTEYNDFLYRLKAKYTSDNCIFFDERDYFKQNLENIMFRDPDHLSPCGQREFSMHLGKEIYTISSTMNHP